jgi:hypothetical protein
MGYLVYIHVVPNNFPIAQEGILGLDFLRDSASIDFVNRVVKWRGAEIPFAHREMVVIPSRSRAIFYLRIKNPEVAVGYVPRLSVCEGVYLGDAVVINRGGKAYIQVVNSRDTDRELIVPTVELQELHSISQNPPLAAREVF